MLPKRYRIGNLVCLTSFIIQWKVLTGRNNDKQETTFALVFEQNPTLIRLGFNDKLLYYHPFSFTFDHLTELAMIINIDRPDTTS